MEPIYKEDITEKELDKAAEIYFMIFSCPDYDIEISSFYRKLFMNSGPDEILKSLVRIISVTNQREMTEHYKAAKALLDKGRFMWFTF